MLCNTTEQEDCYISMKSSRYWRGNIYGILCALLKWTWGDDLETIVCFVLCTHQNHRDVCLKTLNRLHNDHHNRMTAHLLDTSAKIVPSLSTIFAWSILKAIGRFKTSRKQEPEKRAREEHDMRYLQLSLSNQSLVWGSKNWWSAKSSAFLFLIWLIRSPTLPPSRSDCFHAHLQFLVLNRLDNEIAALYVLLYIYVSFCVPICPTICPLWHWSQVTLCTIIKFHPKFWKDIWIVGNVKIFHMSCSPQYLHFSLVESRKSANAYEGIRHHMRFCFFVHRIDYLPKRTMSHSYLNWLSRPYKIS